MRGALQNRCPDRDAEEKERRRCRPIYPAKHRLSSSSDKGGERGGGGGEWEVLEMAPKAEGQDPASGPRLEVLYPTGTGSSGWPEADDGTKGWRDRILLVAGFCPTGTGTSGWPE